MASRQQINLIMALARQRGLDPRAVLAVASREGLGGGIGDQGTSFGPFQLHVGGAFPKGIHGNRHSWAWSRPGLIYALNAISRVAKGLKGRAAINAIVSQFERPLNPGGEIQGALAAYGNFGGRPDVPVSGAQVPMRLPAPPSIGQGSTFLNSVLGGGDLADAIPQILAERRAAAAPRMPLRGAVSPSQPLPAGGVGAVPSELFYDPLGGMKMGRQIGAIGHHSDHVHVAYTNPQAMLAAIALAQRLGLRVGENPYIGQVHPVHVKHSYHYRQFPGLYHGRHLGEAADVSGNPALMARFYRMLARLH